MGADNTTAVTIDILGDATQFQGTVNEIASALRRMDSTTARTSTGVAVFTGQIGKLESTVSVLNTTLKSATVLMPGIELPSQKEATEEIKALNIELRKALETERTANAAFRDSVSSQRTAAALATAAERERVNAMRLRKAAIADLEREEAASADRVRKATQGKYKQMDSDADLRHRSLINALKRNQTAAGAEEAAGGTGHGGGHNFLGGNTRAVGDILDTLTGTMGWGMRANIAAHFARFIPPLLLAYGAIKTAGGAFASNNETNSLMNLSGTSTAPGPLSQFKPWNFEGGQAGAMDANSSEAMEQRRKELQEAITKVQESRKGVGGFFRSAGNFATSGGIGSALGFQGNGNDRSFEAELAARAKMDSYDKQIAEHIRAQTAAREASYGISLAEGELAKLKLDTEEKIAALKDKNGKGEIGNQQYHAAVLDIRSQAKEEEDAITIRKRGREIDLALQSQILAAEVDGNNQAVAAEQAKLDAAKERFLLARNADERNAAEAEGKAAALGLYQAEKQREITLSTAASALALANMRTNADAQHMAALLAEKTLIAERQRNAKTTPDEQIGLGVRAAQNDQAIAAAVAGQTNRSFDIASAVIDAGTGRGMDEEIRALQSKIAIQKGRIIANEGSGMADPGALAEQKAALNGMQKQLADMTENREAGLASAAAETDSLKEQLNHHSELARAIREQFDYTEAIRKATRDGNPELVKQLQSQQKLSDEIRLQEANPWRKEGLKQQLELRKEKENEMKAADEATKRGDTASAASHQKRAAQIQTQIDGIKNGVEPVADSLAEIGGGGNVFGLTGGATGGRKGGLTSGGLTSGGLTSGGLGGSLDDLNTPMALPGHMASPGHMAKALDKIGENTKQPSSSATTPAIMNAVESAKTALAASPDGSGPDVQGAQDAAGSHLSKLTDIHSTLQSIDRKLSAPTGNQSPGGLVIQKL